MTLTIEKNGVTEEKKKLRQEKTYKTAQELFSIEGDDKFKAIVDSYLKEITSVPDYESLEVNTINQTGERRGMKSPAWILFAHELIHALHWYSNEKEYYHMCSISKDVLPDMESLEEQRTITGYYSALFTKLNSVNVEDVICENAFYMALGLTPRIDHDNGVGQKLEVYETPQKHDTYYSWLESKLKHISKIPEDKKDDKEFLETFLWDYPAAICSLSIDLKNDYKFMVMLYARTRGFFDLVPEFKKNQEFLLVAIKFNTNAFFKADQELFKSKDFVIKALKVIDPYEYKSIREDVLNIIDPILQKDPDIQALLG